MAHRKQVIERLCTLYPALDELPVELLESTLDHDATLLIAPPGLLLFEEGAPCRGFPMVLSGELRVARGTPHGRSLELYRVTPGELCVASTSCLFGHALLMAHATAMVTSELVVLSAPAFERWTAHEPFRRYVFGIFADRLADLMALVDAVTFQRLDQRLAAALLGHGAVRLGTHQALADELGTVREIISRLLGRFERAGWIVAGRERIEIRDPAALRAAASGRARPPADGMTPSS